MFKKPCLRLRDLLSLCLTTQAGVRESMMPGTFCLFAQKGRTLRPPVYWPCIISIHEESCLQRWTLLRTVLWMGKIKGIIRVRCMEASMLHLTVSLKGITKINPPPSPTTPPPPPPPPLPWRWGMKKLFAKWFEVMPKFRKGHCFFPHKRNLYKHAYRDTPTPPPKLCSTPPPPRHLKIRLVRPSLTFQLIWQDRLIFTAVFSVKSIYLETATTPPP